MYYKVIYDKNVIDVLDGLTYILYQPLNKIYLICESNESPCGIQSSTQETFYHIEGMTDFPVQDFKTVKLIEIEKDEYDTLKEALGLNEEIVYEEPIEEEPVEEEPTDEEILYSNTLDLVKEQKIRKMSVTCEKIIFDGIDVVLSDEESHHFSLTEYDQLNLFKLETLARSGEEVLPYHEDGELCKFYSATDIITIANVATQYITYHTTYFNSLRAYISSLDNIEEVGAIEYGVDIPEEYQSDVWKEINQNENS